MVLSIAEKIVFMENEIKSNIKYTDIRITKENVDRAKEFKNYIKCGKEEIQNLSRL
jgi:hypothetical protein